MINIADWFVLMLSLVDIFIQMAANKIILIISNYKTSDCNMGKPTVTGA